MPTDETSVAAYSYSSQPHSAPAGKKSGGGKQLYREKEVINYPTNQLLKI